MIYNEKQIPKIAETRPYKTQHQNADNIIISWSQERLFNYLKSKGC